MWEGKAKLMFRFVLVALEVKIHMAARRAKTLEKLPKLCSTKDCFTRDMTYEVALMQQLFSPKRDI